MKTALITGASSGIGEALAHLLESKGYRTILVARREDKLAQFKGEKVIFDLSKDRSPLIALIKKELPDLIINNAGFGIYGEGTDLSISKQMEVVEVNCQALLEITLESAKALKENNKTGIILNVSSAASFQPFPTCAVYAASKAFVTSLSQSLDEELTPFGIRVLVSCPGVVNTEFAETASLGKVKNRKESMTTEFAVQEIWKQIQSKKRLHIFDFKTCLLVRIGQFFLPNSLICRFLKKALQRYNRP